jgi:hypothetical protein
MLCDVMPCDVMRCDVMCVAIDSDGVQSGKKMNVSELAERLLVT